jgi:hypothetical protein
MMTSNDNAQQSGKSDLKLSTITVGSKGIAIFANGFGAKHCHEVFPVRTRDVWPPGTGGSLKKDIDAA